jgi:ketosteroid isomerase-like protein
VARVSTSGGRVLTSIATVASLSACATETPEAWDPESVRTAVEAATWAFHAADTARDAEAVIDLLWPDFTMLADGARVEHAEVVAGSREFMAGLELFDTEWTDVRVLALAPDVAVSSFLFRDSIVTATGELIRSRGPTTLVWVRREGTWRVLLGDADHYPLQN